MFQKFSIRQIRFGLEIPLEFHWNSTEISVNSKGKFHFLVPTLLNFGILGGASEWEVIDGLRRAALPPSVEDQEAEGQVEAA